MLFFEFKIQINLIISKVTTRSQIFLFLEYKWNYKLMGPHQEEEEDDYYYDFLVLERKY